MYDVIFQAFRDCLCSGHNCEEYSQCNIKIQTMFLMKILWVPSHHPLISAE